MCHLLTLLHSAGELMMLRQTYQPPDSETRRQIESNEMRPLKSARGDVSDQLVDLSSLYRGWTQRRWSKLHQFVSQAHHRHLQLCWVRTAFYYTRSALTFTLCLPAFPRICLMYFSEHKLYSEI